MRVKTRNTFITIVSDDPSPPKLRRSSTDPGMVDDSCEKSKESPVTKINPFKVFVGSLPAQCDEHCLGHFMAYFGDVQRVTLKRNQHTGQSRRYGYVKFRSPPSEEIFTSEWSIMGKVVRIKRYSVNPCWKRNYQSDPEETDECGLLEY